MPHKAARYHRFQSTLPLRGATIPVRTTDLKHLFQSTLPLRGATNATTDAMIAILKFQSTLPLRGATWDAPTCFPSTTNFNPHSPCGERLQPVLDDDSAEISIHTPLAGSDESKRKNTNHGYISIHTPLAGSDSSSVTLTGKWPLFQSTLPLRGATVQ